MRVVRQVDATDCGPAALAMILMHFGRLEPLYRLRDLAGTTQSGTTLLGLKRAAEGLGLKATGFTANLLELRQLDLPVLLHWENNHYVVLEKIMTSRLRILDPAVGQVWVSIDEFDQKWTGKALWLEPSEGFQKGRFLGQRGMLGLISHLRHYQDFRIVLFQIAVVTLIVTLLNLGAPLLTQILFDRVLEKRQENILTTVFFGILTVSVLQAGFGALRNLLSSKLSIGLNRRLRLNYLEHLMQLPMRIHETRLVGDLVTRFSDLSRVRSVLSSLLLRVPATLLSLVLSLVLLLTYNFKLALVALLTVPFQVLYLLWLAPKLQLNTRESRRKEGQMQSALLGNLEGLWTLKTFGAQAWASKKVEQQIDDYLKLSWRGTVLSNQSDLSIGLLESLSVMVMLWFGATLVLGQSLSTGQLVAAYGLVLRTMSSIAQIVDNIQSVQEGIVASDRLLEMLELSPEPVEHNAVSLPPLKTSIKLEQVGFGYLPERLILNNITIEIPRGSYTVILGENGAGKSTLAAIMTRMFEPLSGRLLWDSKPFSEINLENLRKQIVYLRQEVPVFDASIKDNLFMGREPQLEQMAYLIAQVGFDSVIKRLPEGLDTLIGGDSPYRLSSGERQMLGLIRALLADSEVLILDEPTATLDQEREHRVVDLLWRLKGTRTIIVITHRPALVEPADQIVRVEAGRTQRFKREPKPSQGREF
jgi:ABC-type bacteriocin/lantibiotic exporter with double-glycine peptidase domain